MITIKFNPYATSLIFEVEVKYKRERIIKMLFDTGASFTVITPKVAEEIGFILSELKTTTLFTASKSENVYQLTLSSLSILDEKVNNLEVRCMPLPKELKIDGLLGLNFLRHFNMGLNFEQGALTFERISHFVM